MMSAGVPDSVPIDVFEGVGGDAMLLGLAMAHGVLALYL